VRGGEMGGGSNLAASSTQPLQTASTAEAELVEVMEGAIMTDAMRVMLEEMVEEPMRC
jgi:hypothetical protein